MQNNESKIKRIRTWVQNYIEISVIILLVVITLIFSVFGSVDISFGLALIAVILTTISTAILLNRQKIEKFQKNVDASFQNLNDTVTSELANVKEQFESTVAIRDDFRNEVSAIVNSSEKELLCLLRTGSILGEEHTKRVFLRALEKGCQFRIIVCHMHRELVKRLSFEMDNAVGLDGVIRKFGHFIEALRKLKEVNDNNIEIRTIDYLPATLEFIADPYLKDGQAFIIPISFKADVREEAPSIRLSKRKHYDIFDYYLNEFERYWDAAEAPDPRRAFFSQLNLSDVTIKLNNTSSISKSKISDIIRIFNKYGWLLIELPDNQIDPRKSLLELRKIFGSTVPHKRSEEDGITVIQNNSQTSNYLSETHHSHPPHTGGTANSSIPRVIAVYCEIPSRQGGVSQIVSGKAIFQHLLINNYKGLVNLCKDQAMTVKRGEEKATRAIFKYLDQKIQISFRNDDVASTKIKPDAQQAFNMICNFIEKPNNIVQFALKPNQIYIVDNTAILHGRTKYNPKFHRRLLRLNMNGESEYSDKLAFGFSEF